MAISLVCRVTVVALKLLTKTVDKQDIYNTACAHTHTHTPTLFPLDNSHRCLSGQFSKPTPVFELNIKAYHRISCTIGSLSPTSKKKIYIQLKPKRTANWQFEATTHSFGFHSKRGSKKDRVQLKQFYTSSLKPPFHKTLVH